MGGSEQVTGLHSELRQPRMQQNLTSLQESEWDADQGQVWEASKGRELREMTAKQEQSLSD